MSATGGRTPPSKASYAVLGVSIVAALWAAAMLTSVGKYAYVYFFAYSEFYMGVISLVALSITIMLGLVATDRLVLSIRQRVLLQSAHRTTGLIAVASLFVHVWTKVAEQHVGVLDVFVPFLVPYNTLFIGLGSLSAYVMVLVMWTGIARSRFIGKGRPWMWRGIHAISYLMWPIALLHGLGAGRPAATWVVVSYVVCVVGVLVGLAVRLSVSLNRRKDFASQAGTGTGKIQPVGKLVPTTTASVKSRGKSRRDDAVVSDRGNAPAAALETWAPAAGASPRTTGAPALREEPVAAPISTAPVSPVPLDAGRRPRRGVDDDERARRRRDFDDSPTQRWEFEDDDMPAARSARYAEDDVPAPRQRRAAAAERFDEPTRAMSRRAVEDGLRRYDEDDEVPVPRGRRRADDEFAEERPRSRRYAGTEFEEEPAPRPRSRRYTDDDDMPAPRTRRAVDDDMPAPRSRRAAEEEAPRSRRFADEDDMPAPRQRRYPEDEHYEEAPPRRRSSRYADDEPPRPSRASRYAEDAETAPRARRDRGADVDSADSGRHSRSEFVDLAGDPRVTADADFMEPDETPTLVDMASRRARRATQQEPARSTSRGARRGGKGGRGMDESVDDQYWRQLRGEAQ
ncbi:ferric reductase-like transmembrane domain-containing protein [Actinoplanes friuliensis]|uniref:Eukaryotic translation initiation factor 3 subunit A n=1 Tax=Actinoplanes friuliensis DSM 7358 TaxID=1246995 RepID=U5W703_9ACTN|nr:ferric reductase-like transmembrane domain-containing protein [Actinoplanes friuliensis]AGZ43711.1 Eukaryotic translation initiation factor 3 subunit A [Actinoplanes friuliensis DSM 7358]